MKAGIVIGTFNNAAHITETIQSVKDQTYRDWSVVLVDNGSTDNTIEIAENQSLNDPRFTIIKKSNEGPSAGRNLGFSKLRDDIKYVHFLDGDDLLHPEFLRTLLNYLEENPQVGLVGCQFDKLNEKGEFIKKGYRSRYCPGLFNFPKELASHIYKTPFETFFSATGQGAFALFRKSVFDKTKGYENSFWSHEDSDIFCQMALKAEVHYLPDRLYKVRVRTTSLTHSTKKNYSDFRDKWDFYFSTNSLENILIENSLKYYYTRHKPFRDFKTSLRALKEAINKPSFHSLKWSFECLFEGLKDLILHKTYRSKKTERHLKRI